MIKRPSLKERLLVLVLVALQSCAAPAFAGPIIWGAGGQAKALNQGGISLQTGQTLNYDGPSNLVKNGRFEDTSTSMWATYADAASAAPTDGTGGSPSVTLSRTTTTANLIEGRATAALAKGASNLQGQGWSYDFTLPAKSSLYSSQVTLSFDYYFSSTSVGSDAVRVYLYDRDAGTLITPSFVSCGGGSTPSLTTIATACHAELAWVSTTSDDYRLIFHVATTSTTAFTFYVDNVYTGEYRAAVGPAVGPEQSYTPTVTSINTVAASGQWSQSGDKMVVRAYFRAQSPTGGTASPITISIPSGYTIDTSRLPVTPASGELRNLVGTGTWMVNSTDVRSIGVYPVSTTTLQFSIPAKNAALGTDIGVLADIDFTATIPIAGWVGSTAFGENRYAYYYSTGNTWGTSNSSATTSQGQGGVLGGTTTPSGTSFTYTFTPTSPVPTGVAPVLQTSPDGVNWSTGSNPAAGSATFENLRFDGTNYIGGTAWLSSNGKINVTFGKYAAGTSTAWTGTWYWRVVVAMPGVVPYGLASTTVPGLRYAEKQYVVGTTYANGTPSISSAQAGFSTLRSTLIPYQTVDGAWRLKFNINTVFTSASVSSFVMTISGVTFVTVIDSAVTVYAQGTSNYFRSYTNPNTGQVATSTSSAVTCNGFVFSGDVELASKPTWAD